MNSTLRSRFRLLLAGILVLLVSKGFKLSSGKSQGDQDSSRAEAGSAEAAAGQPRGPASPP